MKTFVFFFLTLIIATGSTNDVSFPRFHRQFNSSAIIRQLFEMLKYFVKHGYSEKGLPVLDPFHFEYKDVEFSSPAKTLSLRGRFANGVFSGLGNYQLLNAEFIRNEVATDLCLFFPAIVFKSGQYEMQGDIYDSIPLSGIGRFEFDIRNFTYCGKIFFKQSANGKSILIKNINNPSFRINQIESRIEFDGNIDDIVNAMINDLLADYLTRLNRFIAKRYVDQIIAVLNPLLNKFESWRILATLL